MCAFYAFARLTDDVADSTVEDLKRAEWLADWKVLLQQSFESNSVANLLLPRLGNHIDTIARQILPSLIDTVCRYEIDPRLLLEIVDGAMSDQEPRRVETARDLDEYCYLVASTVGLVCLRIWEFEGAETEDAAIACGRAFQLTNILRDIREDHLRGRFYLPLDEARENGLDLASVSLVPNDAWGSLLSLQIGRAIEEFDKGWRAYDGIHPDGKKMFSMMWRSYRSLLREIEKEPLAVLKHRVNVSKKQKLLIASTHFVGTLYNRLPDPVESTTVE